MKMVSLLLFLFCGNWLFAEDKVLDLNGKKVVLHDNFTWEYQKDQQTAPSSSLNLSSTDDQDAVLTSKNSKYTIHFNGGVWRQIKSLNQAAEFSLENNENTGYGMLIYDGLNIPLSTMEDVLIANANNIDPNARILDKVDCTVNGTSGELVTYTAKGKGLDFTLLTFIATKGDSGSLQFTFYTFTSAFEKLKPTFLKAISGLQF